jgi:hypothetical protein
MGKKEDESELQMQGEKNKYAIHRLRSRATIAIFTNTVLCATGNVGLMFARSTMLVRVATNLLRDIDNTTLQVSHRKERGRVRATDVRERERDKYAYHP